MWRVRRWSKSSAWAEHLKRNLPTITMKKEIEKIEQGYLALGELYKSRATIVNRVVGLNVSYTHKEAVISMCKDQLEKIDKMIEKHIDLIKKL